MHRKRLARNKKRAASTLCSLTLLLTTPGYAQQHPWETRVFHDACPTDPAPSDAKVIPALLLSIGSFLIPKLVDFGVNLASQSLQAKKAEEQSKNEARSADSVGIITAFYEDREQSGAPITHVRLDNECLIVIRGDFGPPDELPSDPGKCTKYTDARLNQQKPCDWLRKNGVGTIGIYLEARYTFSDDALSFRLQPNYFAFLRPIKANTAASDSSDGTTGTYDLTYTATYEVAGSGQSTSSFAMAVLLFEQLQPGNVFTRQVLNGKSSGWCPIMPVTSAHGNEFQKIIGLYDTHTSADTKVRELPEQIKATEAKTRLATNAILTLLSKPPLSENKDAIAEGSLLADQTIASEIFDDVIVGAQLDANPETNPTIGNDQVQSAKRKINRQQVLRANAFLRKKINELKSIADIGLGQRVELEKATRDLKNATEEIDRWNARPHPFGPANLKINLREQPHFPTNTFLLTAADALSSSKADLSSFMSQTILKELNLQGKDAEIKKISDDATAAIGANNAVLAVVAAQADLDALPSDASEAAKTQKETAVENAKIAANAAALSACRPAPYPASVGGKNKVSGC